MIESLEMRRRDGIRKEQYEQGCADGAASRASRLSLTPYLRVGIDDYAKGYRAGYFERRVGTLDERAFPKAEVG